MSNSNWGIEFLKEAEEDLRKLDGSVRAIALKAIKKVGRNPLPQSESGYGKPLGNKYGRDLTNLLKIKIKDSGLRVIYSVQKEKQLMKVIIIGVRADDEVYKEAKKRMDRENNSGGRF